MRHLPFVALLVLGTVACSKPPMDDDGQFAETLADGLHFSCLPEDEVDLREPDAGSSGATRRMTSGRDFRVRYLASDGRGDDGRLAMTAVVIFGHTIPLVSQEHFPPPVDAPSNNFLRPASGGYMHFQLDAWADGETTFSWVERDNGVTFAAHGRCWLTD